MTESIKKHYSETTVDAGTSEENKEQSKRALPHVGADKSEAERLCLQRLKTDKINQRIN